MTMTDKAETDSMYRLFFELSPDLLCIAGYDGYFKSVNKAVSDLLGYSFEELYSRPINTFIHPEDQDMTSRARRELTKAKPLHNFENRYLTKSGKIVWLAWTSLPVESDQLIFAIAKNITSRKQVETTRNAMLADLNEANKELKQFTYVTSHDLRSPVNNILSIFNMLDFSKITDRDTVDLLEMLKRSGLQLKETLNNYVDVLSNQQRLNPKLEEIDLDEALCSVLKSIDSLIQTSKTQILIDFSHFDKIIFNKAFIESIFLNLITNSIKYARPDLLPVISIKTKLSDGIKTLVFEDNGLGFDAIKVKDRIFGLHQKFHDHSDSKGIGLYLVYNHVTSLGGQITVESKVNEGTRFTISFK